MTRSQHVDPFPSGPKLRRRVRRTWWVTEDSLLRKFSLRVPMGVRGLLVLEAELGFYVYPILEVE